MRIHAISDIHIDYSENRTWLENLSSYDYKNDVIILAGDVSQHIKLVAEAFRILSTRFKEVFFVPGNHDIWISSEDTTDSLTKLEEIKFTADCYGIHMKPHSIGALTIVPLYSWYDYSFGIPGMELLGAWTDFVACQWPEGEDIYSINKYFIDMNKEFIKEKNDKIITFSHFLPSIELMPAFIPKHKRFIYPVLGSNLLMEDIKKLGSSMHIYGHSHVNRYVEREGIVFVNNAFGYPYETTIAVKQLKCIYET